MAGDHASHEQHVKRPDAAAAVNSHYFARAGDAGIDIQCLQDRQPPFCLPYDTGKPRFHPVLALSPTRPNILAAANGSRVLIFNVAKRRTRCILKGNGRIVTSITFSRREHEIVATGAVDGSICVWSIQRPSRPLHHLNGLPGACNHIAIQSLHTGVLATSHQNRLAVWSLLDLKLLAANDLPDCKSIYLAWRSGESVVSVSSDGCVTEATFDQLQTLPKTWKRPGKKNSSDDGLDTTPWTHDPSGSTTSTRWLMASVQQTMALGANGMVVLPVESNVLYFYSYALREGTHTELWRLHIDSRIECFALQHVESGIDVIIYAGGLCTSYSTPASVLDAMRWSDNSGWVLTRSYLVLKNRPAEGKMLPEKTHRRKAMPGSHSSRKLHVTPTLDKTSRKRLARTPPLEAVTSAPLSLTSSLEIPKQRSHENESNSPMPFLSPSIPARKDGLITPSNEDLSPLPRSLLDTMTSTATHGHDSDSDDETFAGNLRHSGSFLPGGVNVPLPRTCGAAFAANGHLLTFFPFQPRPSSTVTEKLGPKKHLGDGRTLEATSLFPSFANFGVPDVGPTLGSEQSSSLDDAFFQRSSLFEVSAPFLNHRPSWSVKVSPVKTTIRPLPTASKVSVSVRNFEALTPTRKLLATTYNVCAEGPHNAAELSLANAEAATSAAMYEAAEAWRLLAIILEPRSIASLQTHNTKPDYPELTRNQSPFRSTGFSLGTKYSDTEMKHATILQSSNPFGKMWTIDQLFALLEQQADVQLLACMSALLVRAFRSQGGARSTSQHRRISSQSDPTENHSVEFGSAILDVTMIPPAMPILRANPSTLTISEQRPVNRRASQTSSRNISQPPTPYLDSSASTPPLIFPPLTKHGTRVSQSGSISPEHHRSSFSVAAKNYAASIAEKFASYGSSPPVRKSEPGSANELSTSLPNASAAGSWSKSVSFASTLGVSESTERSPSLAQEDDKYDSDRTIDDSLPETPKYASASVSFKLKNENYFTKTVTHRASEVLPGIFLAKSVLWRRHLAEQFRSWGLLQEAAELEAVIGVKQDVRTKALPSAIVCHDIGAVGRATCVICYCVIHTSKQICPNCLHTAHPRCLDEFIFVLGDAAYTCPSGCGCNCTRETDPQYGVAEDALDVEPLPANNFAKFGHERQKH